MINNLFQRYIKPYKNTIALLLAVLFYIWFPIMAFGSFGIMVQLVLCGVFGWFVGTAGAKADLFDRDHFRD